jgi:hypothetical protein
VPEVGRHGWRKCRCRPAAVDDDRGVVAGLLFGVLVAVIVGEQVAGARREIRGEPSPLERVCAAG